MILAESYSYSQSVRLSIALSIVFCPFQLFPWPLARRAGYFLNVQHEITYGNTLIVTITKATQVR